MKRWTSRAILISMSCSAAACCHSVILEAKDTQSLEVHQNFTGNGMTVELSGLAMHSSLVAEGMETRVRGDTMNVRIKLGMTHPGGTGRFHYVLQVPDEVRSVTFGEAGTLIWSR